MRRIICMLALTTAITSPGAFASGPSERCELGFVPSATTPAGAGLRLDSEPMRAGATACNNGQVVPAPGNARTTVGINGAASSATVSIDGDPESTLTRCSDGYTAARASSEGVSLHHSADGGYTSSTRAKPATQIAAELISGCAPAV